MDTYTTLKNPDDWVPGLDAFHEADRQKLPEGIREIYDGGKVGKPPARFHTVIEFEYLMENVLGARSHLSLGMLWVDDPDGRIGFYRGGRIEVNGVEAAVREIDVAKERDQDNRLITFWSVVLGE